MKMWWHFMCWKPKTNADFYVIQLNPMKQAPVRDREFLIRP